MVKSPGLHLTMGCTIQMKKDGLFYARQMNVKDVIITMSRETGIKKKILQSSTRFKLIDFDSGFCAVESRNTGFRIFFVSGTWILNSSCY